MPTTFSSRDFTRDVSAAKRAAGAGPVFITDRGRPAYALLTIEEYYRLAGQSEPSLLDVMQSLPAVPEVEFEPARLDFPIVPARLDD